MSFGGKACFASITHPRSRFALQPCAAATAAIEIPGRVSRAIVMQPGHFPEA